MWSICVCAVCLHDFFIINKYRRPRLNGLLNGGYFLLLTNFHSFIHSFICSASNTCLKNTLKHTTRWAGQQGSALIVARDKTRKKDFLSIICDFDVKKIYA